ncbi:alanine dehydrogenase [Psittacicella gerlachiana]|uniref:Alanine dehydrogenase n=1 Tax=Psittacicella gerlachiana TaxID=2028574 RepID=A0A3A1YBI3_9GAMM|nr:alanine dehydrogenase [Psittacicella gerlachiana]RIY34726.1 alanine dehydrogenase [Psittacicella gerlachiana]
MIIGCPKEIKVQEYRVGLTPDNVRAYVEAGHTVYIEHQAGVAIGFTDQDYLDAGAVLATKAELFAQAQMIIKVKEPIAEEYHYFKPNTILYTYLHLAADRELTEMLVAKNIAAIAYETIKTPQGLPCLQPMSQIAGRLAAIESTKFSQITFGGRGVLFSGVPGTPKGKVLILGGGVVGLNAAQIAMGMGADVTIMDVDANRLAYIDQMFDMRIKTLFSTRENILAELPTADAVIGAVLIPGAKAPKLVRREDLQLMKPGAILTDVAIDQGGCFETSKATTHNDPVYIVDGVVHYCVANMPGCVARTSTIALTNSTLKYGLELASKGVVAACTLDPALKAGLNTYQGHITFPGVAQAFALPYVEADQALAS